MIALLLAVALAGAKTAPAPVLQPPVQSLSEAAYAIQAGRLEQARLMIANAVKAGASGPEVDRLMADLSYATGDYKPALAHFRYFARSTGASRDRWIHVACSWYHDIAPARELDLHCVWLDRDRTGEDPASASAYMQSAAGVPDAVERLWN